MPDFHKLNKTKTTEMSREELKRRLREEAEKSSERERQRSEKARSARANRSIAAQPQRAQKKQMKISAETKKQMPPQSPQRKKREEEIKQREKQERKARKRRKRGSYVIYYITLGVISFLIFAILSVTVLFNAEQIIVEGETIYSDEEIIAASGLKGNENLVRLNTGGIPGRILDALVSLDSAKVKKEFPSTIRIIVEPAVPMANFYYAGKNYVISHVGRVMSIESEKAQCMEVVGYQPGESVVIGDYIKAANPEQDKLISLISDALARAGIANITKLDISDTLSIVLTYEDRIKITIGNTISLDEKLKIAKELIDNHIGEAERVTLDISNTERVVQRPITTTPARTTVPETEETSEDSDSDTTEAPSE